MKMIFIICCLLIVSCASFAIDSSGILPERNLRLLKFVRSNLGKKVGTGDCWSLARTGLLASGGEQRVGYGYVWGEKIDPHKTPLLPGDIMQVFSTEDAQKTPHTLIFLKVSEGGEVVVAEQNFNEQHFVTRRKLNLNNYGKIKKMFFYRAR